MKYRLGRKRRRNLYAQHGELPSDDDVFVALFENEHLAKRVVRLLNVEEQAFESVRDREREILFTPRTPKEQQELLAGKASKPDRADFGHTLDPLPQRKMQDRDNPMCKCGHRASVHAPHGWEFGHCMSADPDDGCVAFEAAPVADLRKPTSPNIPQTPSDECTCGHLYWEHRGVDGPCTQDCDCHVFERRCPTRYIGRWTNRCTLTAGHSVPHVGDDGRAFAAPYTQGGDK